MKIVFFLITFSVVFCSCNQNATQKKIYNKNQLNKIVGEKLIRINFLKYASKKETKRLEQELTNNFNIYEDSIYKCVFIDAEELTEFNFDFFMPMINKLLSKRNILISVKKLNKSESSNEILINKDTIQLYTNNELNTITYLENGPKKFFSKLNQILNSQKCKEKFYLLYSGNDLHTILLTKNEFQLIKSYFRNNISNSPYHP